MDKKQKQKRWEQPRFVIGDGNSTPVYKFLRNTLVTWNEIETYTTLTTQPEDSKGIWLDGTEYKESNIEEQNFWEKVLR